MNAIIAKLKRTRLFANVPEDHLIGLIEKPGITSGKVGDTIKVKAGDLVVVLEGGLVMTSADGGDHLAAFVVEEKAKDPAILYTIPSGAHLELTHKSLYLVIDGDRLDAAMSGAQEAKSVATLDDAVRERVALLLKSAPFKELTFEHICRCAAAMTSVAAKAGTDIVTQGAPGDFFYVIEQGQAEVWRKGEEKGAVSQLVAKLGSGAPFGEEALLQDDKRNATVRMATDGRLLRLAKADFDKLLKSRLVQEVGAEEVSKKLGRRAADLIDCRYEAEWELWRIPNSRLMPLDDIRERARGLDKEREYIVYCRTGRRSRAASFLMRQMGLKAVSLKGGIAAWPHELEGGVLGD